MSSSQKAEHIDQGAQEQFAILIDSGCDVPSDLLERYNIHVVPLLINYSEGSYQDRIDITLEDVAARMPDEIPTTSTPTPAIIYDKMKQIVTDGCKKIIAITISSHLSGTYLAFKAAAQLIQDAEITVIDSKSIALGAGLIALKAARCQAAGSTFEETIAQTRKTVETTTTYFTVNTLEYLHKGGRVSSAEFVFGSLLSVRPIIATNEDGDLVPVAKVRGRKQSLDKIISLAKERAAQYKRYDLAVANGLADDSESFLQMVKAAFPEYENCYVGDICPVIFTHGGAGLIGMAIQGYDE